MRSKIEGLPALNDSCALFLDFDGTLTAIQDDPDTVFLPEGGDALLLKIAERLNNALAILSGRDIRDLSRRVPVSFWRAGGHGLQIFKPGAAPPAEVASAPHELLSAAQAATKGYEGVRVEEKGVVLAIHFRAAPTEGDALAAALGKELADFPDYALERGKMVIELKPPGANKGTALTQMMTEEPFKGRRPLMIGDDTTDEAAMKAAIELGGVAAKVGPGETAATHRFSTPDEVWRWLKEAAKA